MNEEDPEFLYRGTTQSFIEERWNGNTDFPTNWTDDPLQGASYALGYVLGDSENHVPVVLVTEYCEESFSEPSMGVEQNFFPTIPKTDERQPEWYTHEDSARFNSEQERDDILEQFDLNTLDEFNQTYLDQCSVEQRNAVNKAFKDFTSL